MSRVVSNPSPKARFQDTPARVSKHRDMIASTDFEIAADYAMLQYTSKLAMMTTPTFNDYATMGVKITGAKEFLQELRLLAETPSLSAPTITDNLDHSK